MFYENLLWILNESNSTHINWSIFGAKWKHISLDRRRRYRLTVMLSDSIIWSTPNGVRHKPSQTYPQSFKRIDKHLWVYAVFYQYHTYSWYRIFNDMIGHNCCSFCFVFCQTCLSNQLIVLAPRRLSPYVPKFVVKYLCKHCWNNARQILSG